MKNYLYLGADRCKKITIERFYTNFEENSYLSKGDENFEKVKRSLSERANIEFRMDFEDAVGKIGSKEIENLISEKIPLLNDYILNSKVASIGVRVLELNHNTKVYKKTSTTF